MGNNNGTLLWLKDILEKKLTLDEFSKCIKNLNETLEKENISLYDYFQRMNISINNENFENLSNEFFRYCLLLSAIKNMPSLPDEYKYLADKAKYLFNSNILGPICFITSEIADKGKWTTVGGLGIMVFELSQALASLGMEVIIISPYYNQNKDGNSNYLSNETQYIKKISINLDEKYEFNLHYGNHNDIKYYFLHNSYLFPKLYADLGPEMTIKQISSFAKACLQVLCDIHIIPSIICTNDWFTGLIAAYAKNNSFGETFKGTKFIHICHNLEISYEGRIYLSQDQGYFENIYQFNKDWIIDFSWDKIVINPSRCAIMKSDQWATVSHSYKNDLKNNSPLKSLLNEKNTPFLVLMVF